VAKGPAYGVKMETIVSFDLSLDIQCMTAKKLSASGGFALTPWNRGSALNPAGGIAP